MILTHFSGQRKFCGAWHEAGVKISYFQHLRQKEKDEFQSSKSRAREASYMTKVHKEQGSK